MRGLRDNDTDIGGPRDKFPVTRHSAIQALKSRDREENLSAFETIVTSYWKPVYKYVRVKWGQSNEDAKDLTQAFFAKAFEKEFFQSYEPAKASFRTFLRTCLDRFLANEKKAAGRLKRAGGVEHFSLDFDEAEQEIKFDKLPRTSTMEEYFRREWVRSLFSLSTERLRHELELRGKTLHFNLFERYDLDAAGNSDRISYEQLASEFGTSPSSVTNHLAFARREFRRIVLERLREITASDEEFRNEARQILGVRIP